MAGRACAHRELHLLLVNLRVWEALARLPRLVEHRARLEILQFATDERWPFARLHVQKFLHSPRLSFNLNGQADLEILGGAHLKHRRPVRRAPLQRGRAQEGRIAKGSQSGDNGDCGSHHPGEEIRTEIWAGGVFYEYTAGSIV